GARDGRSGRRRRCEMTARVASAFFAVLMVVGTAASTSGEQASPVHHYSAAEVAAAFDRGAVLFDGAGGNYMIHASRREKPGMAEVHAKDADIIYVVDGTATFVTGGHVVGSRETAPDEIRGASIVEGETRHLARGDVIVVPRGTPHQF